MRQPCLSAYGVSLPVCHMYTRKGRKKELWDLACDIAMEAVIDGLYQKCVHVPQSPLRRETYLRLKRQNGGAGGEKQIQTERLDAEMVFPNRKNRQARFLRQSAFTGT